MQGDKGTKDMEHTLFEGHVLCAFQTGIDVSDEVSMKKLIFFPLGHRKGKLTILYYFLHSRLILMKNC